MAPLTRGRQVMTKYVTIILVYTDTQTKYPEYTRKKPTKLTVSTAINSWVLQCG